MMMNYLAQNVLDFLEWFRNKMVYQCRRLMFAKESMNKCHNKALP